MTKYLLNNNRKTEKQLIIGTNPLNKKCLEGHDSCSIIDIFLVI